MMGFKVYKVLFYTLSHLIFIKCKRGQVTFFREVLMQDTSFQVDELGANSNFLTEYSEVCIDADF